MKIKEIYTNSNNFGNLTFVKDNPFARVERFLATLDPVCSQNYYRNKETLRLFLLEKMNFEQVSAAYGTNENFIYAADLEKDLGHELMHMAFTKFVDGQGRTFSDASSWSHELYPLEEGMAEFLSSLINEREIETYGIESFTAKMLYTSTDKKILVPCFCADSDAIIKMFQEKDIHNVLMNLAIFHYNEICGTELNPEYEEEGYTECFCDMLEALIDIEINRGKTQERLGKYRDIFLSSLEEEVIKYEVEDFCQDYHNKARKLIDWKIGRRR